MTAMIDPMLSKIAKNDSCQPWQNTDSGWLSTKWEIQLKKFQSLYLLVFGNWFCWHTMNLHQENGILLGLT